MSDQHIEVPDKCPPSIQMDPGEMLEIVFNQTAFLWNTDPDEFDPPLRIKIYKKGDPSWKGKAKNIETVKYGFLHFPLDMEAAPQEVVTKRGIESGGHTIQVGSRVEFLELEKILKTHPDLCKCWPCVKDLLELLLKMPLQGAVTKFLRLLLSAGDAVCSKKQ